MESRNFIVSETAVTLGISEASFSKPANKAQKEKQASVSETTSGHFDSIVIGAGSMGSSACSFLAERGYNVLGLEQFDITHDKGSHAGQSRIIRKAYYENPDYVPLLKRAYENWKVIEKQTDSTIYVQTGLFYMGMPDSNFIKDVRKSAELHNIPIDIPTLSKANEQYPQFQISPEFDIIFEFDAGFITPERAILAYIENAIKFGAVIKTNEGVIEWKEEGGRLNVVTNKGVYSCDKLVITAGSWASKIIPSLKTELTVTKQMIAWMNPKKWDAFKLGNFPCWFIEDPERGFYYGFPILPAAKFGGPLGLKLAHHHNGEITDPDHVNRDTPASMEENIRYVLSKYIPDANDAILSVKSCLYTNSNDSNFIIDHLPGYDKRVTIACGFSGHGFKFASAVGEILADLAMKGKTDLPIEFLSLRRFVK